MKFPPAFLDEIKARLPASEVVGKRVKLQKAGREWKGLSPFTAEKTPSFFVNDQKMAWFDFSSGQNGNIFDFLMRVEGLTFPEAVKRLAGEAGVPLPEQTPEYDARERARASLRDVLELAARFFEDRLQSQAGARARGYLADRGLTSALQQQFRIGFAPNDRSALREFLAGKNISTEMMIEAGLLVHGDDIPVAYDRFRNRVMFPICDVSGHVIAFGGRALDKDTPAKYLNSPETPLFHKGSVLYNHHRARKAAHDGGPVIAVEGYVDVIALSAIGFSGTVAPLGTALTADQCQLLWRMAEEPILCFDGDSAGRKAAWRAIDTVLPLIGANRSVRFAFLPEGQDPDDLARAGGLDAVRAVLAAARPLVDVIVQREVDAAPLDTPERRAGLAQRLRKVLAQIGDEVLRRYYRDDIASRLEALGHSPGFAPARFAPGYGARRDGGGATNWGNARPSAQGRGRRPFAQAGYNAPNRPVTVSPALTRSAIFTESGASLAARETQILLTLVNHPALLDRYAEHLATLEFVSSDGDKLRHCLLELAGETFSRSEDLRSALRERGMAAALERHDRLTAVATLWCVRATAAPEDAETALVQSLALHRRSRALNKELKLAEFAFGQEGTETNFARLREIQSELSALEGQEAVLDGFGLMSGRHRRPL